ncbi:alpha/beta hydrolase [Chitinophaga sedimenti]|uniref:alpha/beta fold hydrolase n=1 Tax=Chitinophaga sedimenti TaxID=2033606 RepID=UPI0020039405|nr:alpha/beta fold hydrolase [Chitinophaga sedimenti]MCK7559505.1 alpha/beta hydrolase [Chitinophaga sedimenti]
MTEATVLFIQGGGAGAYEEDHRLVEDLSSRLERGNIIYPKMPDEDNPDYDSWKSAIAEELTGISGGVLLVAHSVGAFIVLKYLLENEPNRHITGLFFIATPFVGAGGWELDMALDAAAYKRPLPAPVFFYHGTADEIVPFEHWRFTKRPFRRPFSERSTVAGINWITIWRKLPVISILSLKK